MSPTEGKRTAVALIGMPGVGKSTVGRALAARLGVAFVDLDAEVERMSGRSVAEIFATEGEASFRRREAAVLADVSSRGDVVVACGGGIVTTGAGREALGACRRVLLEADVAELATRVGDEGGGRPLLAGDVRTRLEALAEERGARYRQLAQVVVPTGGRAVEEIAASIVAELRSWAA